MASKVASKDDSSAEDASKDKKKEKAPPEPMATFGELYQFTTVGEKLLLLLGLCAMTGAGVAQPMMLIAFNTLFTQLGTSSVVDGAQVSDEKMMELLWIMISIGGFVFVMDFIGIWSVYYVTATQMQAYKRAYLKAVLRQDVGWYDVSNPEELSTMFAEALLKVQKGLKAQNMICLGTGMAVGSTVIAFLPSLGNAEVSGVTIATVPLLFVAGVVMMWFVGNGERLREKAYARAGGIASETLFSMRTVTSLGIETKFAERYRASLSHVRRVTVVNQTLFQFSVGLFLASYLVMVVVAVIYGSFRLAHEIDSSAFDLVVRDPASGYDVYYCADERQQPTNVSYGVPCTTPLHMTCQLGGALELVGGTTLSALAENGAFEVPPGQDNVTFLEAMGFGNIDALRNYVKTNGPSEYVSYNDKYFACSMAGGNMLMAIFAIMFMGQGFAMIGQPLQHLSLARVSAAKVIAIINRVPTIDSFSDKGEKPSKVDGAIEVKDVIFAYPSAPDHLVCKGYSLSVPAGQTVALCGPSGSGKSTIVQLLQRFYDPAGGEVRAGGVALATLDVAWWRSQLGFVGQEPVLFDATLEENVKYGKTDATQQELDAVAKLANLDFVLDGRVAWADAIGPRGDRLSGGQKQRVAIARALVREPKVLLLDEATSALDSESERVVQEALDAARRGRTTFAIAHRLSTIQDADVIVVLVDGSITEQGTHAELLAKKGVYYSLHLKAAA